MDYCSEIATSSCQPNLNMYDREAVPLTLPNHSSTSNAYSSPLHSPTSTTNGTMMPQHPLPPQQPPHPHHFHSPLSSLSSQPSAAQGRPLHPSQPPQSPQEHASPSNPVSTSRQGDQESSLDGDNSLQDADDNSLNQGSDSTVGGGIVDSSNPKQVFVPCKVCGDKASGYHYGVTSCEGCKGFFRRSIQKQIDYRCLRDGKCLVIRLNRNRCQHCRFRKCLAVGMSRDSVRYGRVPKRSKSMEQASALQQQQQQQQAAQQQQQPNSTTPDTPDGSSNNPSPPSMTVGGGPPMGMGGMGGVGTGEEDKQRQLNQIVIYDIVLTVAQFHHCHCLITEDKVKHLPRTPLSLSPVKEEEELGSNGASIEMPELHRCLMFNTLTDLITPTIQNIVEFAKRIPGFNDIGQDDQLMLIKAGFFEAWLTQLAKYVDGERGTMMFANGSVVSRTQLETVLSPEIVNGMFSFSHSFATLGLNDTEIGLFTAIILTTADRVSVLDRAKVERVQSRLIEALKLQLARRRGENTSSPPTSPSGGVPHPAVFPAVLQKLPELRSLGTQLASLLDWFRHRWHRLSLPPLFAEIFDIPKSEDDL